MSNLPSIDELKESFNRIYDGPDHLQHEYDIVREAQRLNMPVDIYRRFYDLRAEEKRKFLSRKGIFWLLLTGVVVLGHYILEAPTRQKQAHYQAWQMINSASGQEASGGRIEAMQDLAKDGVSMQSLHAPEAHLGSIKLKNANLTNADLKFAHLEGADLRGVNLTNAHLEGADLQGANFQGANLTNASLWRADFQGADLQGANLTNADLQGADLVGAENLTPTQIKAAKNWDKAKYNPEFRKQLGLSPENSESPNSGSKQVSQSKISPIPTSTKSSQPNSSPKTPAKTKSRP